MKLEKWAMIAEIVGAAAIVISLVFVGLQVRQGNDATVANTQAIQSQVLQTMMNAEIDILSNAVEYPYLASVAFIPEEGGDSDSSRRASAYFFTMLRSREQAWRQLQSGILDQATYVSYRNVLIAMLEFSPYYRRQWQNQIDVFEAVIPEFASDINAELARRANTENGPVR